MQKDMKLFPFKVVEREGKPVIRIENNNKEYQAEEISAMVLGKMKETAECVLTSSLVSSLFCVLLWSPSGFQRTPATYPTLPFKPGSPYSPAIPRRRSRRAFLGKSIKNAVVTVPAYFNDAQRQVTQHLPPCSPSSRLSVFCLPPRLKWMPRFPRPFPHPPWVLSTWTTPRRL